MKRQRYEAYIGVTPREEEGFIYQVLFDPERDRLEVCSRTPSHSPAFLCLGQNERYLYAVDEHKDGGAIETFARQKDGGLKLLQRTDTAGTFTTFLHAGPFGRWLTATASGAGRAYVYRLANGQPVPPCQCLTHEGMIQPEGASRPQCCVHAPDGRYLFVTDLELHIVDVYSVAEDGGCVFKESISFPGAAPRHLLFHPNGKVAYIIGEEDCRIYVMRYDPENPHPLALLCVTDPLSKGGYWAGGIRLSRNGSWLAATERTKNRICLFAVEERSGMLTQKCSLQVPGSCPRDFNFTPDGAYLLLGLQDSDRLVVYRCSEEEGLCLTGAFCEICHPTCVVFSEGGIQ